MTTIAELLGKWTERDNRYSMRRKNGAGIYLTDGEVASIRAFRRSETLDLDDDDQRLASMALERWTPPVPLR